MENQKLDEYYSEHSSTIFSEMLGEDENYRRLKKAKIAAEKALRDEARVKDMMRFMQAHYKRELTVSQIAASASISKSECLRCFRAVIGVTPIQYLRQFRVQKAAELLAGTALKISDLGAPCGFQETSYFIKTFRELMGRTPAAYRTQKKALPK